jgi:uncharacterized repeat protein (TIGR02543 family)
MPNFTIQYDPNGANGPNAFFNETGLPAPQYFAPYTTVPISSIYPYTVLGNTGPLTKSGSTFNGWNTLANPTVLNPGTPYAAGATYNNDPSGNLILYAQWV